MERGRTKAPVTPLRHRIPNPPPVFVGREAELARLQAAVARGPLTVLWGRGGLGKTALVAELVRRHFGDALPRALLVGMRPGDTVAQLEGAVLRALCAADQLEEPAVDVTALIDLAERDGRLVVLEDLHNGAFEDVHALLTTIARYARSSRWIVATREDPMLTELAEQIVALGSMRYDDLRQLAVSIGCDGMLLDDGRVPPAGSAAGWRGGSIDGLVRDAHGSPWRLRQLVGGARLGADSDLLVDVSPAARALLDHLVALDLPLSLEVLAQIAPVPDAAELALLERRGIVERSAGGLRLHDVTRSELAARSGRPAVHAGELHAALARTGDPAALIEGVRLALERDDLAAAAAIVEAHHPVLAAAGLAPRLWALLERTTDARLMRLKRHIALAVGSAPALAWAAGQPPPAATAFDDRLAWLRALSLRGDLARSVAIAGELAADARAAGGGAASIVAFEATMLQARAHYTVGRPGDGVAVLRPCSDPDPLRALRRDAMLARCLSAIGEYREALDIVERLGGTRDLPPAVFREIQQQRAAVLFSTGRIRDTALALGAGGSELTPSPRSVVRDMHLAVEGGELTRAAELLVSLQRFPMLLPLERMHTFTMGARLHIATGELELAAHEITSAIELAIASGAGRVYYWAVACRLYIGTITGQAVDLDWHRGFRSPTAVSAAWLAEFERAYALRHGARKPAVRAPDILNLDAHARLLDAEEAVHDGELAAALDHVEAGLELARRTGLVLLEADAVRLRAEILAVSGRFHDVAREAAALAALAAAMPSPRYAIEGRLVAVIAAAVPDVAALAEIAAATAVAPEAARRAQRLLGLPGREDAFDAVVLVAIRKHWAAFELRHVGADPDGPIALAPWGIDTIACEVQRESGARVSLRRYPLLLKLLARCAAAGGWASKARLAAEIWGVREYHPHRDDPRIQMAVSRVRKLIDGDGAPPHLAAANDGYALQLPCWLLV